jgi:hypothetical protein
MTSIPARASRQPDDETEDDDAYYPQRPHTSAIRYTPARQQVIQRGNKRIIIHNEPPLRRRVPGSVILVSGMALMLVLLLLGSAAVAWYQNYRLDSIYGNPRTFQTDQVVGHGDSTDHPTHFIFLNLNGRVVIIELPGGDISRAHIYRGPAIIGDNPASVPVTAEFEDVNGDGKPDMIVHIGNQQFTFVNDGTEFKPQQ